MNKLNEVTQLTAMVADCRGPATRCPSKLHRDIYNIHARLEALAEVLADEEGSRR